MISLDRANFCKKEKKPNEFIQRVGVTSSFTVSVFLPAEAPCCCVLGGGACGVPGYCHRLCFIFKLVLGGVWWNSEH